LSRSTMYGSQHPSEVSNNPFLNLSDASTRYPDVSGSTLSTDSQYALWNAQSNGVSPQPGYSPNVLQPLQQQYTTGWPGLQTYQTQGSGLPYLQQSNSGVRFHPSSAFGQQLVSTIDPGSLNQGGSGYQQQSQQQFDPGYGMTNGYNTTAVPGQIQNTLMSYQPTGTIPVTNLTQFDPYSVIGQGAWDSQQQQQGGGLTNSRALNSHPDPHPRDVLEEHKEELKLWEPHAWKKLMNSFGTLETAWRKRVEELETWMNTYPSQLPTALEEAKSRFATAAAAKCQVEEAQKGYRVSTDQPSKDRVKEAVNAALRGLPDYP